MINWTAIGALVTAGSVFIGLFARYVQEDLKRTRLRYYLRPMEAPGGHRASILTVVNTGRSTARNVLVYLSPRHLTTDELPIVYPIMVATDEKWHLNQSPTRNDLIVRFPELHPSDCFIISFTWKGGAGEFTRKHKNCFRISYEFGTSNKLFRLFGRVHRFWWWQRQRVNKEDKMSPRILPIQNTALQELIMRMDHCKVMNPARLLNSEIKRGMNMTSIVIELQRDALDDSVETPTLLRKALFVAKKLRVKSSIGWIVSELEGYTGNLEIPDYRQVIGRTVGRTATQELPFLCDDPEIAKLTSTFSLPISISEIDSLLKSQSSCMLLAIPLPPNLQTIFNSLIHYNAIFMFQMDYSQIEHIRQSVRTKILNWGIKLEEDGVLGEGYTFTSEERKKGNHISISISGDTSNFQIQQAGSNAIQNQSIASSVKNKLTQYIEGVTEQLESLDFDEKDYKEVTAELETISTQLELPSPKKSIIANSLSGLLKILSTVAARELVQEGISLISSLV